MYAIKSKIVRVILQAILMVYSFIVLYPLYIMLITSFKSNIEVMKKPFGFPLKLRFEAFQKVWGTANFINYYKNSIIVTIVSIILIIVVSVLASYILGRYTFKAGRIIYFYFFCRDDDTYKAWCSKSFWYFFKTWFI